jgi:hypothetical protein
VECKHIWQICWTRRRKRLARMKAACLSFMQCVFKNRPLPGRTDYWWLHEGCSTLHTMTRSPYSLFLFFYSFL